MNSNKHFLIKLHPTPLIPKLGAILLFLLPLQLFSQVKVDKPTPVTISGESDQAHNGDTLKLVINKYGLEDKAFEKEVTTVIKGKSFKFILPPLNSPQYITLVLATTRSKGNLYSYLIEPGDSVFLTYKFGEVAFRGKGSKKFECRYKGDSIYSEYLKGLTTTNLDPQGIKKYFTVVDKSAEERIKLVESYSNKMSKNATNLLYNDILCGVEIFKLRYLNNVYSNDSSKLIFSKALGGYHNFIMEKIKRVYNPVFIYSNTYADCIIEKYLFDTGTCNLKRLDIEKAYQYFYSNYSGKVRERIIVSLLLNNRRSFHDISPFVKKALAFITNEDFRLTLKRMADTITVGSKSYAFSLPDSSGKVWHQEDFRGKIVLIDYWFTGCSNCKDIAPIVQQIESKFTGKDVVFITVSIDKSRIKWVNSLKEGQYTSPYSINLYTEGKGINHPLLAYYNIDAFPTILLIDKSGNLGVNPQDPRIDNGLNLQRSIEGLLKK